jgi:hypothetical protein
LVLCAWLSFASRCSKLSLTPPLQAGSVITLRIIFLLMSLIITNKGYFAPVACEKLASRYMLDSAERVLQKFPDCQAFFDGVDPEKMVLVQAAFAAAGGKAGTQASLTLTFGAAWWLAIAMHAIGVEAYVCRSGS